MECRFPYRRRDPPTVSTRALRRSAGKRRRKGPGQIDFFGASTGAAAALRAVARLGPVVRAVVSRGGRPDLTGPEIRDVRSPTLLIVGELDTQVLELNRRAYAELNTDKELAIVPGATHLFEEPGTLEEVTRLACDWFVRHVA